LQFLVVERQTPRDQSLYHRHGMQAGSVAIVERTKSASHMLLYVLEVCRTPVAGFMRAHSTVTLNASFLDAGVHFDRQIDRNDLPWTALASRLTGGASGHATSFRRYSGSNAVNGRFLARFFMCLFANETDERER
jgi:hypothetical protein